MMWASSSSPIPARQLPCVPRLSIASRISIPPERCFVVAFSNKFQRRPPSQNYGDDHHTTTNNSAQDIGGLGRTVLTALKSNPQSKPINPRVQNGTSSIKFKTSNSKQEERHLSGSDVLLALQRATAQKIKKKRRDSPSSSTSKVAKNRGRSGSDQEDEEDTRDYSNVRPICIKSDWTTRLDELDKRLQELIDTAIIR